MRPAVTGLGAIAKKTYLPILTVKEGVEPLISARSKAVSEEISNEYNINRAYTNIENLLKEDIGAAIISTHADGYYEIAKKLIKQDISVYIDKPTNFNFEEAKEVESLAKGRNVIAMIGFNRRFCPKVKELKGRGKADIIVMRKNKEYPPGDIRRFIVEDFIHVVDTLRFLMNEEVKNTDVNHLKNGNDLHNIVVALKGSDATAVGIMNRTAGITEENIEYMIKGNKYIVEDLVDTIEVNSSGKTKTSFEGWDPTLYKRGFGGIIDHFIESVKNKFIPNLTVSDSVRTYEICENIVRFITTNEWIKLLKMNTKSKIIEEMYK